MSEIHRITVDPELCSRRPTLRNLRIRVKDVLDLLAAGASHAEILEDYAELEYGDIQAALEYAARQSDHPSFTSLNALPGRCSASAGTRSLAVRARP